MQRFVLVVCSVLMSASSSLAQDNPVLRNLLSQMTRSELSKHSSKDTAFYSEGKQNHTEWAEIRNPITHKVIGKTIIAQYTDESRTWVWFDDPAHNLSVTVTRLELPKTVAVKTLVGVKHKKLPFGGEISVPEFKVEQKPNDRFYFGVEGDGKVVFNASGKVQRVISGSLNGSARFNVVVEGSFTFKDSVIAGAQISNFTAHLHDVRSSNSVVGALQGPLLDWLTNHFLDNNSARIQQNIRS